MDAKLIAVFDALDSKIKAVTKAVGPAGRDGADGKDGKDGKDGINGVDGADGAPGPAGANGTDGSDGADGVSIVSVMIDFDKHLVVTLSNGDTIDAGSIEDLAGNLSPTYNVSVRNTTELSSNIDLNNKGFTAKFMLGVDGVADNVYVMDSSGKMQLSDSDSEIATNALVGLLLGDTPADELGTFLLKGFYPLSGFTPGSVLYLDATAGQLRATPPDTTGSFVRVIGYSTNNDEIFFDPDKTWIEVI